MTYGYWQDTRNRTCFGAPLTTVAAPCTAFGHAHSVLTSVSAFQSACAPSHNHATEQLAPCGPWHARLLSALASTVSTGWGHRPRLRVLLRVPHWGGRMRAGLLPGRAQAGHVYQACQRVQRLAPTRAQAGVRVGPFPPARRRVCTSRGALCSPQRPVCCIFSLSSVRGVYIVWLRPLHSHAVSISQGRLRMQTSRCRASLQLWEQRAEAAADQCIEIVGGQHNLDWRRPARRCCCFLACIKLSGMQA